VAETYTSPGGVTLVVDGRYAMLGGGVYTPPAERQYGRVLRLSHTDAAALSAALEASAAGADVDDSWTTLGPTVDGYSVNLTGGDSTASADSAESAAKIVASNWTFFLGFIRRLHLVPIYVPAVDVHDVAARLAAFAAQQPTR
jgi:hypothetical protein